MYKICVGLFGLSAVDYWSMTPKEVFLFIEAKTPEEKIGSLSVDEIDELANLFEQAEAMNND